jgi:hypothetical protein
MTQPIVSRAIVVLDVELAQGTQALHPIQQIRTRRSVFRVVKEIRDLRKSSLARETEEWVSVLEAVAVEAIFRTFEGESANAVSFHTAAVFEVPKKGRELSPG